jgi:hypothetical protein
MHTLLPLAVAGLWITAIVIATLVLAIAALVSVWGSEGLTQTQRWVWVVLVIIFPLVGPIVYFVVRRNS